MTRLDSVLISEDVTIIQTPLKYQLTLCPNNIVLEDIMGLAFDLPAVMREVSNFEHDFECESDEFKLKLLKMFSAQKPLEQVKGELVTNTSLVDASVDLNKGCFLGFETVSKIESRRGAAKKNVLVTIDEYMCPENFDEVKVNEKKVTPITWFLDKKKLYIELKLDRSERVNNKTIQLKIDGSEYAGTVNTLAYRFFDLNSWTENKFLNSVNAFHESLGEEKAKALLKFIICVNPSYEDAYESLGVIYARQEDFNTAISYLKQLEKINPDSVLVHTNLSLNYMKIGQIELAEEHKGARYRQDIRVVWQKASSDEQEEKTENEKRCFYKS